jgi:hypothetical protein
MKNTEEQPVSIIIRTILAIPVATALFIFGQWLLIYGTNGTGRWEGMTIFFGSLVLVPLLLAANVWVVLTRFTNICKVLAASLALPLTVVFVEYIWLYGPTKYKKLVDFILNDGTLLWTSGIVILLPLIVTSVVRVVKRFRRTE